MSIKIIRRGIQDVFYTTGRFGYQHIGVNPAGVMDSFAMQVANALTLNQPNRAVLEMHFPAAEILFQEDALIAITGADFTPSINNDTVRNHQPIMVQAGAVLKFLEPVFGARTYLSVNGGFTLTNWLGSDSTNLVCNAGGHNGRALETGDIIGLQSVGHRMAGPWDCKALPFWANVHEQYAQQSIQLLPGRHFETLTNESKSLLEEDSFIISADSNRMGYRLQGEPMISKETMSLLSTAVTMGTIQLLPNGQLIILMADHQTTGGYPMIAHVISADLPRIAQTMPGSTISFTIIDTAVAKQAFKKQQQHIRHIQNACNLRVNEYGVHVHC